MLAAAVHCNVSPNAADNVPLYICCCELVRSWFDVFSTPFSDLRPVLKPAVVPFNVQQRFGDDKDGSDSGRCPGSSRKS